MTSLSRLLLASALVLAGCTATGSPDPAAPRARDGATATGSATTGACGSKIETGPLPDWADAGFSGDTSVPHVFGVKGDIVAVLFGNPLGHNKTDGTSNKILWVSRTPTFGDTLRITAKLDQSPTQVTREVSGGPGPSIIDLPQPGCWHLELRWSANTDTMDLVYAN